MTSPLLDFVDKAYSAMLGIYPAAFRERFAAEMAQVFRSLCRQTYIESGSSAVLAVWLSATWDGMLAAVQQWYFHLRKQRMGNMNTDRTDRRDVIDPLTPLQAAAAVLPFLLFGISSLASKASFYQFAPPTPPVWIILMVHPFLIFNWLVLIGLAVGLLSGFPRWAHAYLVYALLFAMWWDGASFAGFHAKYYFWLTFFGAFLVALAVRRSWQPLRSLLRGLWSDWTLPSLAIYILYGSVFMMYDSNHHPYLVAFMISTTLAISLGAFGYFRSMSPLRRVLFLTVGLLLAAVLSGINEATWDFGAYYGLPNIRQQFNLFGVIISSVFGLLMIGNGLLARWRVLRRTADR